MSRTLSLPVPFAWPALPGVVSVWLWRARGRARGREALPMLTEHDFHDMAAGRSTLAYELNKPFWRE